ncbi:diguanylate cyclase [Liquorilactobacillus mali]|nr:diguanylate cyclase [Liquorilactobacillus mali]
MLLENTSIELVHTKLNSFIRYLQAENYNTESGKKLHVSCSGGIADSHNFGTIYETVRAADDALYQAKKKGKARVAVNSASGFVAEKVKVDSVQ